MKHFLTSRSLANETDSDEATEKPEAKPVSSDET